MSIIQRCIFIEGIGRVHALGPSDGPPTDFAAMDVGDSVGAQIKFGNAAAEIMTGQASGRIRWSVRFSEKDAGQ